jgi:hypothetical protein
LARHEAGFAALAGLPSTLGLRRAPAQITNRGLLFFVEGANLHRSIEIHVERLATDERDLREFKLVRLPHSSISWAAYQCA